MKRCWKLFSAKIESSGPLTCSSSAILALARGSRSLVISAILSIVHEMFVALCLDAPLSLLLGRLFLVRRTPVNHAFVTRLSTLPCLPQQLPSMYNSFKSLLFGGTPVTSRHT